MPVFYVISWPVYENDLRDGFYTQARVVSLTNPGNPLCDQPEDRELVAGPLKDESLAQLVADSATDQTEALEALS